MKILIQVLRSLKKGNLNVFRLVLFFAFSSMLFNVMNAQELIPNDPLSSLTRNETNKAVCEELLNL